MQQQASSRVLNLVGVLLVPVEVGRAQRDFLTRSTWDGTTRHEAPPARILKPVRGEPTPSHGEPLPA